MSELGKPLFIAGLVLAGVGLLLWSGVGRTWLGRLPGDIHITGERYSLHVPIVTCLVLSLVLSAVVWLARRF